MQIDKKTGLITIEEGDFFEEAPAVRPFQIRGYPPISYFVSAKLTSKDRLTSKGVYLLTDETWNLKACCPAGSGHFETEELAVRALERAQTPHTA
jgi:hypothetical protein